MRRRSRRGWGPQFLSRWLWGNTQQQPASRKGGAATQSQRGLGGSEESCAFPNVAPGSGCLHAHRRSVWKPVSCPTPCRADCPSPGQTLRPSGPRTHMGRCPHGACVSQASSSSACSTVVGTSRTLRGRQVTTSPSALQEPPQHLQRPPLSLGRSSPEMPPALHHWRGQSTVQDVPRVKAADAGGLPACPVVRTPCFHCLGPRVNPW